nr:hypothetical protein DM860_007001 [Ipomoea trifida]
MASAADAPADNSVVGTLDGGATTTAAPVGGPIPASVYESLSPAGTPSSGATTVRASVAAATLVAASFFF